MRTVYTLIALAALLAACGHKGPLYLPMPKPGAQKPEAQKPATPPAPQEEKQPGKM